MTQPGTPAVTMLDLARALAAYAKAGRWNKVADKSSINITSSAQEVHRVTVTVPASKRVNVLLNGSLAVTGSNLQPIWQVGFALVGGSYVSGTATMQRMAHRGLVSPQQVVDLASAGSAPTAGTFTVSITKPGGTTYTTSAIAYNATPGTVQTAIQGLTGIGSGNVTVESAANGGPYRVTFYGAALDAAGRSPVVTASGASLTGGSVTTTGTNIAPRYIDNQWHMVAGEVDLSAFCTAQNLVQGDQIDILWQVVAGSTGSGTMDFSSAGGTGAQMMVVPV